MERLLFVFSLMFSSCCVHATNIEKQYDVSFSLGDFVITRENQVLNVSTSLKEFALCGDTTKPALPYKVVNILLPYNYEYNGYEFSYNADTLYSNVSLYNTPPDIPTNVSNASYTPTIASTSINTPILEPSEYIYCGYRYVSFLLTPFQYDAKEKVLSFVEKINIKVKMKEVGGKAPMCNNDVYAYIKKMVINNDEITSYGEQAKKNTYTDGKIGACCYS